MARPKINTWFFTLHTIIIIVFFSIYSLAAHLDKGAFNKENISIIDIITFTIGNHTTTGTVNIYPNTIFTKIVTNIHRLLSFSLIAGIIIQLAPQ